MTNHPNRRARFAQYHLKHDAGNGKLDNWPNGCWAVYRITGDEIAERISFSGNVVVARDSWPGYIGLFETLPQAMVAIEADRDNIKDAT